MSTEIEQLQSRIDRLRYDLDKAEAEMTRIINDSTPPEQQNIYSIRTMEDVNRVLMGGRWLCNYRPGYIAVFEPRGGGSYGGIYGALADELGKIHDPHNFDVYEHRKAAGEQL